MKPRRRVLVLTSRYPYPVVGGDRLRIYEICRELARHHDLTLLSLCETGAELVAPLPDDGVFARIERVHLPRQHSLARTLAALPLRTPLQVAYYRSPEFARCIRRELPVHDLCLAHLIRTGDYVRQCPIPTVLEMTDAISLNYRRVRATLGVRTPRALVYSVEADRLLRYERSVLDEFDAVTLVSDIDRKYLLDGQERANVFTVGNGVHLDALPFSERRDSAPVAVFIGNLTSLQNLDACFHFTHDILPALRARLDFTLRVVGRIRPREARLLSDQPGVEVLANVANVAHSVGNARIGIAPMRTGAGVQNKILEYMALGLPVIASPIGFEGLDAIPGRDLLLASSAQEYVDQVTDLWNSPDRRSALALAGHAYVAREHLWSARLRKLVDVVDALCEGQVRKRTT